MRISDWSSDVCSSDLIAAHSIGYHVIRIRYGAVLFGGAMAGLGGGYLSLSVPPMWIEGLTAGRGWLALALVAFASWRPGSLLVGAYLFGGVTSLALYLQRSEERRVGNAGVITCRSRG